MNPSFQLSLFGGPRLREGSRTITLSPSQRCFLAYLYGHQGDGVRREKVIPLFWPDHEEAKARRSLNQLLYSLKKRTDGIPLFESRGNHQLLKSSRVRSDLQVFEDSLEKGKLGPCFELLQKSFAPDTLPGPTDAFSDWVQARDLALQDRLREKAARCFTLRRDRADWKGVREAADVLLRLDPLDEGALRSAMEARANVGGVEEAEAAFRAFSRRVEEETGMPWTPESLTEAALQELRAAADAMEAGTFFSPGVDLPDPSFHGREEPLSRLRKALRRAPEEDIRVSLVTGEAGIGKTRLIQEALVGIPREGHRVLVGDTAELETLIPLNPLIEAFKGPVVTEVLATLDEPWRTVLYGVMPGHYPGGGPVPDAPSIQPGSVPRRLFEAFHQLLSALCAEQPLILVLENLHWADETSLSVLEFLTRRWRDGRLQFLFSMRTEEITQADTLEKFLEHLRSYERFLELHLEDLAPEASACLIQELSPDRLQEEDVAYLRSLAGGNPFFLIELTLEFLAGRIEQDDRPSGVLTIPLSIRQVLQRRLSQLSQDADRVLGSLAVHGRAMHLQDLSEITDVPVSRCVAALEQLQGFRLIRGGGPQITIRHELIRHAVYQELSESRRTWLHGSVARHLLQARTDAPPDELAVHFHHAGEAKQARHFASEAASRAETAGAIPEALRYLAIAREHTDDPEVAAELIGRMGHLHYLHQNLEEAAPLLEFAAQRFRRQGKVAAALEAELEGIDCLAKTNRLPIRDCLEELQAIKEEAEGLGCWALFMDVLDVEIHHLNRGRNLDRVLNVLEMARAHRNVHDPKARCKAHSILALAMYFGSPGCGLGAAREAVAIARRTEDSDLLLHALNRLIVALMHRGELHTPEGKDALMEGERISVNSGDLVLKFFVRLNRAVWHLEIGEIPESMAAFHAARKVIQGTKAREAHVLLHINQGDARLSDFQIPEARSEYLLAEEHLTQSSPEFHQITVTAGLGLCALLEGDLGEAKRREGLLPPLPAFWTFEPSLVATFQARMMLKRGASREADDFLRETAQGIKGRFVLAWLKLILERQKVLQKRSPELALEVLKEGQKVAQELGLTSRAREFERAAFRIRNTSS